MTRHLAKALDAIWYLSMGLFLGLTGGLVLSVILTFRGARELDASPGVEPYRDPKFAEYHNDVVAGYIGQDLFMVGGTVALVLLGIAALSRLGHFLVLVKRPGQIAGSSGFSLLRGIALFACITLMLGTASITRSMNAAWPDLYDTAADQNHLRELRKSFAASHQISESISRYAWLCGFAALAISPWCRRIADLPDKESEESQQ
jgi:hypothetical protein